MNWVIHKAVLSITLALIASSTQMSGSALGGILGGQPAILGPGTPLGFSTQSTIDVNNDDVGVGNPNQVSLPGLEIFGLDPIDISVPAANSPFTSGTTEYFIELGSAINKTEADWVGFSIALGSGIGDGFSRISEAPIQGVEGLDFDTPDRNPPVTSPTFQSITHEPDLITFTDGLVRFDEVASGQNFSLDLPDITNSLANNYQFTIRLQALTAPDMEGDFNHDNEVDGADFLLWQRDQNVGSFLEWQTAFRTIDEDYDLDGDIDGTDFLLWQSGQELGSLSGWQANYGRTDEDFDRDGDVDGADFLRWQRNLTAGSLTDWRASYGNNVSQNSQLIAVPEPTNLALLGLGLFCMAFRGVTR